MIGQTVSHYRIISKLGEGGMGDVYLAADERLGRKVALKFLAAELARDREALARFRNEARAVAELSHPNIAVLHDIDEFEGRPFLVLEHLEGQTLSQRIAQGPLPIGEAARIAKAIVSGLVEAHSRAIVHRDIKSANVMLTPKGEVKILDFGLAQRDDATRLTRPGSTLGTIGYMSPEQASGEEVDERSDVWSVGVVLYECLTGRLPFVGQGASVLEQIKEGQPPPPTGLRTGIPMEFEQVVLRCLQKDPSLRYQHADDLLASLRVAGGSTSPVPPSSTARPFTARRARIASLVLGLSLAVALLWRLWPDSSVEPVSPDGDFSVAVIDFGDLTAAPERLAGEILTSLIQTGLIEISPCRVVSLEYLKDLRRRRFGESSGPIAVSQALELAREANASALVVGSILDDPGGPVASWRLVDCTKGEDLHGGRVRGASFFALADATTDGIVQRLQELCGSKSTPSASAVASQTTGSSDAYASYVEAMRLRREDADAKRARELLASAVAIDSTFALAWFELSRLQPQPIPEQNTRGEYTAIAWELRDRLGIKDRLRLQAWRDRERYEVQEAFSLYEEILTRWPDDRATLHDYGNDLADLWYFARAVEIGERGTRLYPDDVPFWDFRVTGLCGLGRTDEARRLLEQPRHLRDEPPLRELVVLRREGDVDSAWRVVDRWRSSVGSGFEVTRVELETLHAKGDVDAAITVAEQALARSVPGSFDERLLRLSVWFTPGLSALEAEKGRFHAAWEVIAGWSPDLRDRVALATELGEPADVRSLVGVLRKNITSPGDYRRDAVAWAMLDSFERAEECIANFQRQDRLYQHWALRARAIRALAEGRPNDALSMLEAYAAEGMPPLGYFDLAHRKLMARSLADAGELKTSADAWREILRVYRGHFPAGYELGKVLERMGRVDEAGEEYRRFLHAWRDADPDRPKLIDARRRLDALASSDR